MRTKRTSLHYSNSSTPSIESQNLETFADERLFGEILKILNKNESNAKVKTTMDDLEMFTRCLLVCYFYGFSAKTMWDHIDGFPYFTKAIENLGDIVKFRKIRSNFKSPKMKVELTWDNYFDENPHIRELEKIMASNCGSVINHKSNRNYN